MINCRAYIIIYDLWITGQATRADLECHAQTCPECRRQAAELTQAAASATMPDYERAVEELERMER